MTSPLEPGRYGTAAAFRAALEARLRQVCDGDPARLNLMRTQFAIGRFLARLELARPGAWIAKGGSSMLARFAGRCRLSRDLDLQRRDLHEAGVPALAEAAAMEAGDWLRYRVEWTSPLRQTEVVGLKSRVVATLDRRELTQFDVDLVDDETPAGRLHRCRPFLPLAVAGAPEPETHLYPVEDHLADKLSAMGKVRRYGDVVVTSTRYRDLADLALFATSTPAAAGPLLAALDVPARHWAREAFGETGLRVPGPEWPDRYADTLRFEPFVAARWPTVADALAAAKPLVDPALAGTARGSWDPTDAAWHPVPD